MPDPRTLPTALVAAASLLLGFGVAEATGVRALGGAVLLAGVAICVPAWRDRAGTGVALGLTGLYAGVFVLSHVIADSVGAWGAVFIAAALMGAAAYAVADRRESRPLGT